MSIRPGAPRAPAPAQGSQRRADPGEPGSWMRQVLGFARKPAVVPAAEPARPPRAPVLPADVVELREELGALLLDFEQDHAAHTMRHLVVVHDELGRGGWPGVEALPARVLAKARVQAEMLASREPSINLADFVERLQLVEIAAGVRDGDEPPIAEPAVPPEEELAEMARFVEVSDTSFEEYELMERSWVGTVPSGLGKTGREHYVDPPVLDRVIDPPILLEKLEPQLLDEGLEIRDLGDEPALAPAVPDRPVEPPDRERWIDFERD